MEFCGIVCEFNPFHNGHKYIIEKAKEITGKNILCLMSGNFVQRGVPAIQDKYTRARNAINNGANSVLELPTIYACSNAENFAFGAIKILSKLNVSHIAFGIENTELEILDKIAQLKLENSERFKLAFKNEIQNGINYNTALKRSIAKTLNDENIIQILNKPNNILAVEYLTAIKKLKSKIVPVAIQRCDNGFISSISQEEFLSATSIRNLALNNENTEKYLPKNAKIEQFFNKNHEKILNILQISKIRELPAKSLEKFYDYSEGIEYRVKDCFNKCGEFDEIKSMIETPRYRLPRVNKLLLYPLLKITKDIVKKSKNSKPVCKVLAIRKQEINLLREYNKNKITLIATNKDYNNLTKTQSKIIDIDLNASSIYSTVLEQKNNLDKVIGTLFL